LRQVAKGGKPLGLPAGPHGQTCAPNRVLPECTDEQGAKARGTGGGVA